MIFTMARWFRSDRKPAPGYQRCLTSTAIPGSSPASGRSAPTHLQQPWRRIHGRAGLKDGRIHDLRHSYASRALALGESLTMIGRPLGHTQVQTTARYAHLARDSIQTAVARIIGSIGGNLSSVQGANKTTRQ